MIKHLLPAKSKSSQFPLPFQILTFLIAFFFFFISSSAVFAEGNIWYVTEFGGFPQHEGFSWEGASSDLQTIIDNSSSGDQIWVAGGTYPISRFGQGLELKEDVKIYCGFECTETELRQRDLRSEQNQRTIRGEGTHMHTIFNYQSSASFSNLAVTGNRGTHNGVGVTNVNSSSISVNVMVSSDNGGGIGNSGSSMRFINSSPSTVLINCTMVGPNQPGGIDNTLGFRDYPDQ